MVAGDSHPLAEVEAMGVVALRQDGENVITKTPGGKQVCLG